MKMVRVLFLGFLMLMIPSVTKSQEVEESFVRAFFETKAQLEYYEINDWSVISQSFSSFEEMSELQKEIFASLGICQENLHTTKEFDDGYRIMDTEGITLSGDFFRIILHTSKVPDKLEGPDQTFLVINVTSQDPDRLTQLSDMIKTTLTTVGGKSRISTCIAGVFDGKITENAKSEVLWRFSNYLKVIDILTYSDDNSTNLVGFSPLLAEGIEVLGKEYNVNLILRYDEDDDQTHLWVGTPVISMEH